MTRSLFLLIAGCCFCFSLQANDFSLGQLAGVKRLDYDKLATLSCYELYHEASYLEPHGQNIRSVFINEKTDTLASAIGSFYRPAVTFYYTFAIPWNYKESYRQHKNTRSLDIIRQRLAALRCFEK